VLAAAHFLLLYALTRNGSSTTFYPIGIPLTLWVAVSVAHLVFCIVGITRANKRAVFKVPAIPFYRS
jgi:hypothetical protein